MTKILLDPVDFDALHLSALAFGGIGAAHRFEPDNVTPHCVVGHADWYGGLNYHDANGYESPMAQRLAADGLTYDVNDKVVPREKVAFTDYIKLLNIDIKEGD